MQLSFRQSNDPPLLKKNWLALKIFTSHMFIVLSLSLPTFVPSFSSLIQKCLVSLPPAGGSLFSETQAHF